MTLFTQLMGAIVARPPAIQLGPASSSEGPTNKKGRKATVLPLFHEKKVYHFTYNATHLLSKGHEIKAVSVVQWRWPFEKYIKPLSCERDDHTDTVCSLCVFSFTTKAYFLWVTKYFSLVACAQSSAAIGFVLARRPLWGRLRLRCGLPYYDT